MSWKDKFPKENIYFETSNGILYCGNCLEVMKKFPDECVNLIVTSPPYNKGYWSKNRNINNGFRTKSRRIDYGVFNDCMNPKDYERWQIDVLTECVRILRKDGSIFYNHIDILRDHQTIHPLYVYRFAVKQIIIWNRKNTPKLDKSYFFPVTEYIFWIQKTKTSRVKFNRKLAKIQTNIWEITPAIKNPHPAPFPEQLPENCVLVTTDENDLVLDPFAGSSTVAVVCEKLNRKWICIEINPEYCELSKQRIEEGNNEL